MGMYIDSLINAEKVESSLNREISEKDDMYLGNADHYFACGKAALILIVGFLAATRREKPKTILDFACGSGRVARYIRAAFPEASLVVSDLNPESTAFCAKVSNGDPVISTRDLDECSLNRKFDLIWSGSLLTHLDENNGRKFLQFLNRHLTDNGIAVFSMHGRYVAERGKNGQVPYGLAEPGYRDLCKTYYEGKYAYVDYPGIKGYGISITPMQWLLDTIDGMPGLTFLGWLERGWDRHQDIICIAKTLL